ncbi:MAG: gamma-glutamyl-gamma-aminobutyrate hydrolase family protein [Rhodovibrionaceae bacterium]|nr:gamma-glutamyl-gamma-aminobutyrate hydrolase family protein [Rhodovibrionaceae bacterium]
MDMTTRLPEPSHAPHPLIGVPACVKTIEGHDFHAAGDKYVRAVMTAAEGLPLVLPSFGDLYDLPAVIGRLDGLMLTGSPSNVHPAHYGEPANPKAEPHDEARDATTLPLIREALAQGLPLFAICRGFQELNVALGGTLDPRVHEIEQRMDHRRPDDPDIDVQYGPRHKVALTPGGQLEALAGGPEATVNSLHWQGIRRLADGLVVEAVAEDGTIEGVRVRDAKSFALGVQWHPEYRVLENPFYTALFKAFGDAARHRAMARQPAVSPSLEAMGV